MERRLAGPWRRLAEGKDRMLARAGRWSVEALEWRPSPAAWSVADVVEHLVLSEAGVAFGLAKEPSSDRPRSFRGDHWFRWPALRVVLLTGVRLRAPVDAILPRRELSWEALAERWSRQRVELERWLDAADPAVLGHPRFKHPIAGWLTVPQAITFAADHLGHHLQQVGRIERHLGRRPG